MSDDGEGCGERVGGRGVSCDDMRSHRVGDAESGARIDDVRVAHTIDFDELHGRPGCRQGTVRQP